MLSLTELSIYIITLSAAYMLPGPDMALVMAAASGKGFKQAMVTSIGLSSARGLHVLLSGVGLAALLATHPDLLQIIQWIGAAYLLFMAWKIISAKSLSQQEAASEQKSTSGHGQSQQARQAIHRGFLTNLLNPKALMFCSLLLPQFIHPESGPVIVQYLYLGVLLVLVGLVFDMAVAASTCAVASRVKVSRTGQMVQKLLFSGVFVAGAIRLSLSEL
ncbi:LysE family translocator [Oceanospirillum maris]|uniref:LysE family translocator n=1 Tax=Oceanospirillum maris TaxID=64977 RepID=UPI0003F7CB71|nr:LysE family translocator [Oceanospirillum maris]